MNIITVHSKRLDLCQCNLHYLLMAKAYKHNFILVSKIKDLMYNKMIYAAKRFGHIKHIIHDTDHAGLRGSINHRNSLRLAADKLDPNQEYTLILDCDTFIVNRNALDILEKHVKRYDFELYGAVQHRRKYIHPSVMCIKTDLLIKNIDKINTEFGDCMEVFSKIINNKCEMEEGEYGYHAKGDNKIGCYYLVDNKECFFHMLGGTRNENGFDNYTKEMCDQIEDHVKTHFMQDFFVIIPTYGPLDDSLRITYNKFLELGIPEHKLWIMSGDLNVMTYTGIDHCSVAYTPKLSYSKAYIMNSAVCQLPAQRYLINDRDIIPNEKVIDWAINNKKPFSINHTGVWYNNRTVLEKTAPAGSVTFDYNTFMTAGGFDTNMTGVGLEDREFNNRVAYIYGTKPNLLPRLETELDHIDHERRLSYDNYKNSIRDKVIKGVVDVNDTRHIWDFITYE